MSSPAFGFDDVVGQDDAKLSLVLAAIDPRIGGVLLRGQKGSGKTTLARGLAALLGDGPFVELPLSTTEDRLVGSLDAGAALTGGGLEFRPGLLAQANGGVLYVDEINLLADHLVDSLLDVAVSGENIVERDGISHRHPARFVLVATMNPEEGELRPQLLDRFGFCVDIVAPTDVEMRVEALGRRLAFDAYPLDDLGVEQLGGNRLTIPVEGVASVGLARLSREVLEAASRLALAVGAEGLRADLTLCRAASALAGLESRSEAEVDDLRRVAPLALAHRSRHGPFDPPALSSEDLDQAIDSALNGVPEEGDDSSGPDPGDSAEYDQQGGTSGNESAPGESAMPIGTPRRIALGKVGMTQSVRGRYVRDEAAGDEGAIAVLPTARALARRRAEDPTAKLSLQDLRSEIRVAPKSRTIVLCVDLSGSMGAATRAEAATGTALGLLSHAYQRRDRVAVVGYRGSGAEVLMSPTASIEIARARLEKMQTGGETPLAEGILCGLDLALGAASAESESLLVLLTDGRATGSPGAVDAALAAGTKVRTGGMPALLLDCETGPVRLGLAQPLAHAMGAEHIAVSDLAPAAVSDVLRTALMHSQSTS